MAHRWENQYASRVHLLDVDAGLAEVLSDEDLALARRYAVADVLEFARGTHDPSGLKGDGLLGLLVIDGLFIRRVAVAHRHCGELVGPGSVLRPWDDFGMAAPLPFEVSWRVIRDVQLARLDRRFLATIVRWPALIDAFTARAIERSHTLAFNVAIHCLRRVHVRLIALFWQLADRFGRVTPEGIHVPLPLSHSDLAELIGAQRPSVTLGLQMLGERRLVWRHPDAKTWLLSLQPPNELGDLRHEAFEAKEDELVEGDDADPEDSEDLRVGS